MNTVNNLMNVLIVEDIIDSGLTLSSLVAALKTRRPKSLMVLISKWLRMVVWRCHY